MPRLRLGFRRRSPKSPPDLPEPRSNRADTKLLGGFSSPLVLLARDPTRTDVALPELPASMKTLLGDVGQRSTAHLRTLLALMVLSPNWAHYPQTLDVLFRLLDKPPPSNRVNADDNHRVEVAVLTLDCLLLVARAHITTDSVHIEGSLFATRFLTFWPALWEWMRYLYYWTEGGLDTTFLSKSRPLTQARIRNMVAIQGFLSVAFHRDIGRPAIRLSNAILATPGVCLMLLEIWTRQFDRPRDEGLALDCLSIDFALKDFLMSPTLDTNELINAMCADRQSAVFGLLKPLHLVAYGGESWMSVYCSTLRIYYLIFRHALPIHDMIWSHPHAAVYICHAFTIFSSLPQPSDSNRREPDTYTLEQCIDSTYRMVLKALITTDPLAFIIEAIHSGLICSMLRCASWRSTQNEEVSITVLRLFRSHTIYRPVLKLVIKTIQSTAVKNLEKSISRDGDFWKDWSSFSQQVDDFIQTKVAFNLEGRPARKCAAPECHVTESDSGSILRSCSACKITVYCSLSCQKQAWKNGSHRATCKRIRDNPAMRVQTGIRDLVFFAFWSDQEMTRQQEAIAKLRDEALSATATPLSQGQQLGLVFDFSACPPSFSVIPVPEYRPPSTIVGAGRSLLQPTFSFQYGKNTTMFPMPTKCAGPLFGWIELPSRELETGDQSWNFFDQENIGEGFCVVRTLELTAPSQSCPNRSTEEGG
ncbi:hypothetical protein Hypma_001691 [Hypsizygus marmoreus]|uniref:MYND-type domain-containing protein n=1 Tax=Hypsizygus marmoreus TaxID=39966 RepID=A0A369J568_HYPMA|nr:hypothetical protein Hypma_001691 [Hypsizygus marmoreus]